MSFEIFKTVLKERIKPRGFVNVRDQITGELTRKTLEAALEGEGDPTPEEEDRTKTAASALGQSDVEKRRRKRASSFSPVLLRRPTLGKSGSLGLQGV